MAKRIAWSDQAKTDIRAIKQPIALQILHTLGRYAKTETGNVKQLRGTDPPLSRLRTQNHRVLFHDKGDLIEIVRVLDRKKAYR